jgi:hypothetical protein
VQQPLLEHGRRNSAPGRSEPGKKRSRRGPAGGAVHLSKHGSKGPSSAAPNETARAPRLADEEERRPPNLEFR